MGSLKGIGFALINLVILGLMLKLYTESVKDKNMDRRGESKQLVDCRGGKTVRHMGFVKHKRGDAV